MKIKHWQGYGSVTAERMNVQKQGDMKQVRIKVHGNHEWGLVRWDEYDVFKWLVKRFCKDCESYRDMRILNIEDGYQRAGNIDEEYAIYTIAYRPI